MNKKLQWFTQNYQQTKDECIKILTDAQKDYPFTLEQIQEGCIELRKINIKEKDHLPTHVRLLGELGNVGIKASIAGEKLREAILKSKN